MSSETKKKTSHRSIPDGDNFKAFIQSGWAPRDTTLPEPHPWTTHTARRRAALSARFPGEYLVFPSGDLKIRANDTDHAFRPDSSFTYLSGWAADAEPDSVLVLEPTGAQGHEAVLYFRPLAGRDSDEFYGDARYGELWVGPRPSLEYMSAALGLTCRNISELDANLAKGASTIRMIPGIDPAMSKKVEALRASHTSTDQAPANEHEDGLNVDEQLMRAMSELRLCKDEYEISEIRKAIEATKTGFEGLISHLPEAKARGRGERWAEQALGIYARHQGNGVGYHSICASGDNATILHWTRNDGHIEDGDILLIDAGIELDSLYTADITRSIPVSGTFTPVQRKIYDAVYEAHAAALAAVKPGNKFSEINAAAMRVIAAKIEEWGLLPEGVTAAQSLDPEEGGFHRRWMVHGTSHHLGLDVHDCTKLARKDYMDADLRPGMVLTIEPGLYFKSDDLLAPEEFRGIGIRTEDNVVVTEDGYENLSAIFPRSADEIEAWIAQVQSTAS